MKEITNLLPQGGGIHYLSLMFGEVGILSTKDILSFFLSKLGGAKK